MSIPKARSNESMPNFMERCVSDPYMNKIYKNKTQRVAICSLELKLRDEEVKSKKFKIQSEKS